MIPVRALQLATLVDEAPAGDDWLHEQKFDGYRILAELDHGRVQLWSRRFHDWTARMPMIAQAVAELRAESAVIDGEVAAVLPDGRTSFQALQNSFSGTPATLRYFAFDLLALGGQDLTRRPIEERKAKLAQLVGGRKLIKYSDHVVGRGDEMFRAACKAGLEGIVSKRRGSVYAPGRGASWVKTKCLLRQELVVGGFTEPEGARNGIGSLLVGHYADGKLVYAGKVGTGFSHRQLVELLAQLQPLERTGSPFSPEPPRAWTGSKRHWVEPTLVIEVQFSEWTDEGRLRHPSFQGIRVDKRPIDVVRERPVHAV